MDCQISPIPEQICLSLLSLRFHYLLPFSICSDELSNHIFAEQKTPSQCSMDRFSKEHSLGFDGQRQSLTIYAKSTRYSWRFTERFHCSEKPLRFYFLNSGSITVITLSPSCCLLALSHLLTSASIALPHTSPAPDWISCSRGWSQARQPWWSLSAQDLPAAGLESLRGRCTLPPRRASADRGSAGTEEPQ